MSVKLNFGQIITVFCLVTFLSLPQVIFAQEDEQQSYNQEAVISTAREMIESAKYCALITLDKTGHPDARIMDPFPPGEDMVIWLGTNLNSRKVKQIKNDLRVSLYYQAPNLTGYVLIKGNAHIVDDTLKKQTYWKKEWSRFYSENKSDYVLIKVLPDILEIIDFEHGITGDSKTWAVPFVQFKPSK